MVLRPTLLLIFGNPKAGTPLMQSAQRVGIDLPLSPDGRRRQGDALTITPSGPGC